METFSKTTWQSLMSTVKAIKCTRKYTILTSLFSGSSGSNEETRHELEWAKWCWGKPFRKIVKENKKHCIVCIHLHLTGWLVRDTWYHVKCVELDHTFAYNAAVFVCHLCIKKTFLDIFVTISNAFWIITPGTLLLLCWINLHCYQKTK